MRDLRNLHATLPNARPLAGGLDLLDELKRGIEVCHLISLHDVEDLHSIERHEDTLVIGAMSTHHAVATHPLVRQYLPDFSALCENIGHPRIRFTGTLVGNLISACPQYDILPALIALGARLTCAHAAEVPPDAVPAGALVINIRLPVRARLLVARELHPSVSLYLAISQDRKKRLAAGGAHTTPPSVEIPDQIYNVPEFARQLAATIPATLSDQHVSAAWRTRMIEHLTTRLLGSL